MCLNNLFQDDSCLWIILIILVILCCGNNNGCGCEANNYRRNDYRCGCGCGCN